MSPDSVKNYFLLLFLLFAFYMKAQILIPWLGSNGTYGFADENGKVVFRTKIDQPLRVFSKTDVAHPITLGGTTIHLLRNGTIVKFALYAGQVDWITPEGKSKILPNLAFVDFGLKMELVHLKSGVKKDYLHSRNITQPKWFKVYNEYSYLVNDSSCKFHYGAYRVHKDSEKVNFVDTSLHEIFQQDFAFGTIAGNGYFILANQKHKLGVGDMNGKIRLPLIWDQLEMSKKPGFFIVNQDKEAYGKNIKPRVGLVNDAGKLVIDTIHHSIYAFSDRYLLVSNQKKSGIMDYSGKWVLPQDFVSIAYYFDDYFRVEYSNLAQNIINSRGEKQFDKDYKHIVATGLGLHKRFQIECISKDNLSSLADTNFIFTYKDSLTRILSFVELKDRSKVHFYVNDGGVDYYYDDKKGVRDGKGKQIIPGKFNRIQKFNFAEKDYYLVMKDSLYGVYDTEGNILLATEYLQIMGNVQKPQWWAQKQTDKSFVRYSVPDGSLDNSSKTIPFLSQSSIYSIASKQKATHEIILPDGSIVHDSIINKYKKWPQLQTSTGERFFCNDFTDPVMMLNSNLKTFIPEGFVIPRNRFYAPEISTGYITVYKMKRDGKEESCGVINHKGEWVLPAKKGVRYFPMSENLIAERGADQNTNFRSDEIEKVKIFRLQNGKTIETFDVNLIAFRLFTLDNNFTMLMGNAGKNNEFAYYHSSGEKLTDDNLVDGGRFLERINIVTIRDKNKGILDVIMNQEGKIICELPGLEADRVYNRGDHWRIKYFTAKDKKTGLQGVLDTLGKTILPFSYKDLNILLPGRIVCNTNINGFTELRDWQGRILHTAAGTSLRHNIRIYESHNGYILISFENLHETAVISPENTLTHIIPGTSPGRYSKPSEDMWNIIPFDMKNKIVFVDISSGIIFKE
ncbi:MAG: WG repeat-containing protein [Saprospiraceae bacterium]|nr:WG repeat-containing protein [Saprospiraceae bacterium]